MRTRRETDRGVAGVKVRTQAGSSTWLFAALSATAIVLACLAAYGGSLSYDFVADDLHLVVDRLEAYRVSFPIGEAFASSFWKGGSHGALPGEKKDYYRPLVTLSYATDARLWGERPSGYHLTNLFLHALASGMVLLLLLRLGSRRITALAGALLFAMHPIHVANVSWISGRTDLLCAVFLLVAYDRLAESIDRQAAQRGERTGRLANGVIGLFAYGLALLSKEMAVAFPGLLALHILLRRAQASRKELSVRATLGLGEFGAVILVTVFYVIFRAVILGLPDFQAGVRSQDVPFRPGALPAILTYYWRVFIIPGTYQFKVPFHPILSVIDPRVLVGTILLGLQAAAGVVLLRRGHVSGLGAGWVLVSLIPVSHVVPLAFRGVVTEYWAYIPSVRFVILVVSAVPEIVRRLLPGIRRSTVAPPRVAAAVLAVFALTGLVQIPSRSKPLDSEESHLLHQVRVDPADVESWVSLASEYGSRGQIDRAFSCIFEATSRAPRIRGAQLSLGNLYDLRGQPDSAEAAYRREIRFHPTSDETRVSLAEMRLRKGDEAEAVTLYKDVLAGGGYPVDEIVKRAMTLLEAATDPGSSLTGARRQEALSLGVGILASLEAAGADLDKPTLVSRVDAETRLARIERAEKVLLEAGDAGTPPSRLELFTPVLSLLRGSPGAAAQAARIWKENAAALRYARDLALFYQAVGRTDLALPEWRALLRGGFLSPEELNHIAVAAQEKSVGDTATSAAPTQILEMLLEEKPDNPLALLNLGGLALRAGEVKRCRELWGRFLTLYPDHSEAATVREKLKAMR